MRNWQEDMELCQRATPEPWEVTVKWNADYCLIKGRNWDIAQVIYDDDRRSWKTKYELAFVEGDAQFIAESRQALPYWLNAYRKLEAETAAMREVLGVIKFPGFMGWMLPDDYTFATGITAREFRAIANALSSTAGKELLDRLQKAEVVVEVAKDTCEELWGHGLIAIEALQKALDDLEGGGA